MYTRNDTAPTDWFVVVLVSTGCSEFHTEESVLCITSMSSIVCRSHATDWRYGGICRQVEIPVRINAKSF